MSASPEAQATASATTTAQSPQDALGTLPACCSEAFKEYYRRGEVPRFGCYDPVYLRQPAGSAAASAAASSSFFPPLSSLVREYAGQGAASASLTLDSVTAGEDGDDGGDGVVEGRMREAAPRSAERARPLYSWEHITSAEDMWNGPPLTMKIPPASDYERILLDRA